MSSIRTITPRSMPERLDGALIQHLFSSIAVTSGRRQGSGVVTIPVPMALFTYDPEKLMQHRTHIQHLLSLLHPDFFKGDGTHLDIGLMDRTNKTVPDLNRDDVFKLLVLGIACECVTVSYLLFSQRKWSRGVPMYLVRLDQSGE